MRFFENAPFFGGFKPKPKGQPHLLLRGGGVSGKKKHPYLVNLRKQDNFKKRRKQKRSSRLDT